MQAMREVVEASDDPFRTAQRLVRQSSCLRFGVVPHQPKIDHEERDLLADVIVQLPGDSRALAFLRMQQPAAQVAKSLVTRSKRLLAGAKFALGAVSPHAVNE